MAFLYEFFLDNPKSYHSNIAYWHKYLGVELKRNEIVYTKYLSDRFNNGKLFYDGNPIFNAIIPSEKKAFRIIQESPKEFELFYESFFEEKERFLELTIVLTLTREHREKAITEIIEWIKSNS